VTRGYQITKIKEKLIDLLQNSKTGLSGIEIAEKLGISRITITKYLNILVAEGLVRQKNIGNVNLWFVEEGVDQLHFPTDFFQVKNKYLQYVLAASQKEAHTILRNSLHSGAEPVKIITEVIVPAIKSVQDSYEKGKIGKSEKNFLDEIILDSIQIIRLMETENDPKKNAVIFSTDFKESILSKAAFAALHAADWTVSHLGDMSSAIDVMFDIDLQKFLNKFWIKKQGIMIIIIFSDTENKLKFFSEAVNSSKAKFGKTLHIVLCTSLSKTKAKADFVSNDLENVLQWCQTVYESSQS
jgi:predicted transcriptional regulator